MTEGRPNRFKVQVKQPRLDSLHKVKDLVHQDTENVLEVGKHFKGLN